MRTRVKPKPSIPPLRELAAEMLVALESEQTRRKGKTVDEWNRSEISRMAFEVNAWRHALRRTLFRRSEIERVELLAVGHVDYSSKFALYCAELILQD